MNLSFYTLQRANAQRLTKWHTGRDWSLAEWTNALCGEAGEAANEAKKILRVDTGMVGNFDVSREELLEKLSNEIADVVIYCSLIAHVLDIDLGDQVTQVFNKKSEQLGFVERL